MTGALTMLDAVTWANLPPLRPRAVAGYLDGPRSAWPAQAWAAFAGTPHLVISVLADDAAQVFDWEYGDVTGLPVVAACRRRLARGQWSVIYCNRSTLPAVTAALATAGLGWSDAALWPHPGIYLWVADPDRRDHLDVPGQPVRPVAVQTFWEPGYDVSSCFGTFPAYPLPAGAAPAPMLSHCVAVMAGPGDAGYWLVQADGGVFTHGPIPFYGSMGGHPLAAPVVGGCATRAGDGYWLTGADGGVFAFGRARFLGAGA